MPVVELVYDDGCPNVEEARGQLRRALAQAGLPARWREWRATDLDVPTRVRGFGSPAVLIDGKDVAGAEPVPDMQCCRVYERTDGRRGTPAVEQIVAALARGDTRPGGREREQPPSRGRLAMVPAIGIALLPKVACPACWPAYAGLLSSLGLGFLMKNTVLLPLTSAFLAVAVGALAFRARRRRGFGPFWLGLLGAGVVLAGKFAFDSTPAMYAFLAVLVAGSVWNGWPVARRVDSCASCADGQEAEQEKLKAAL